MRNVPAAIFAWLALLTVAHAEPATQPAGPPTLVLHLRVIDAQTNLPVAQVQVSSTESRSPDQFFYTPFDAGPAKDFPGDKVDWSFYDDRWAYVLHVQASGYATAATRIVKASERQANLELKLSKATTAALPLRTRAGLPAVGAKAYIAMPTLDLNVIVAGSPKNLISPIATSGTDGILRFSPPSEAYRLAICHPQGWAEVSPGTQGMKPVTLTPWASATVTAGPADKPVAGAMVETMTYISEEQGCPIDWLGFYTTDAAGRVAITECATPDLMLHVAPKTGTAGWSSAEVRCQVKPGEHVGLSVMSGKTMVCAALPEVPGYRWSMVTMERVGAPAQLPNGLNRLSEAEQRSAAEKAMHAGADEPAQNVENEIYCRLRNDGSIAVDDVRPGTYVLYGFSQAIPAGAKGSESATLAQPPMIRWYFSVPTVQPPSVALGQLPLATSGEATLRLAQMVPELRAVTVDGKPFDLTTCRGHWTLLNFWGTWCGFCIAEEPTLKDAYEGWAADGRLTMVSASVDDTVEQVRRHVADAHIPWTQLVLGPRDQTKVPQAFGVDGYPATLLISPQGKLVDDGLRGGGIRESLLKNIGPPSPPTSRPTTAAGPLP